MAPFLRQLEPHISPMESLRHVQTGETAGPSVEPATHPMSDGAGAGEHAESRATCDSSPKHKSKREKRRQFRATKREKAKLGKSEEQQARKCVEQVSLLGLPGSLDDQLTALREHFNVEYVHSSLPMDGPVDHKAVEALLNRPAKYQKKYVQQEASLLQKLYQMGVGPDDCIVDLGCGNGTLAILSSLVFRASAIGVDMETPRKELCAESYVPQGCKFRFRRIERDLREPTLVADTIAAMRELGAHRLAIVCKHLCGTGTDLCLRYIQDLQQRNVEIIGCIVATCCYHKIVNDRETYEVLHDVRSPYLDQICRWSMWKSTALSDSNYMSTTHVECAFAFEDMIQASRIRFLRRLFPHVHEVLFISQQISPHNRALVASSAPLRTSGSWASTGFLTALTELKERWNLWPHGIVSKRFGLDGRELPEVAHRTKTHSEHPEVAHTTKTDNELPEVVHAPITDTELPEVVHATITDTELPEVVHATIAESAPVEVVHATITDSAPAEVVCITKTDSAHAEVVHTTKTSSMPVEVVHATKIDSAHAEVSLDLVRRRSSSVETNTASNVTRIHADAQT